MKIRPLNIGVESITRWRVDDEIHLPEARGLNPTFLPADRPLDEILRRPSLDERLPALMQPNTLDPDLLQPAMLAAVRESVQQRFVKAAAAHSGRKRDILNAAAKQLEDDIELDDSVRLALAALLRG